MKKSIAWFLAPLVFVGCGERTPKPLNKVVVLVDGSGSFSSRREEAVARAVTLLDRMAERKVHRWEKETDQVVVISLDALPAVVWEGNVGDLKTVDRAEWTKRFRARSDYSGCTDVVSAFTLAAQYLDGDPRTVRKFLIAFTDLISEPPTTSMGACRKREMLPDSDFPWDYLADVSVSVFWVPPDQILRWRRAAEEQGIGSNFQLYSTSESTSVTLLPPPPAKVELSAEERTQKRQQFAESAKGWVKWGAAAGVLFLAILLFAVMAQRRRQPNRIAVRPLSRPQVAPASRLSPRGPAVRGRPFPTPGGPRF